METRTITRVNEAMPAEREERLIWIGQQMSDFRWEIGDLINRQISENCEAGHEIPEMAVYAHVARLVGKSSSSVRRYAYVAEFYSSAMRDEFEPLYFEHFKFAMRFKERWRELLDAALRHMDASGGKLPSVDWMAANFTGASQLTAQLDDVEEQAAVDDIVNGPVTDDPWSPDDPTMPSPDDPGAASGGFIVNNLARVLDYLRRVGEKLPVSEETRERLLILADAFESVLAEIRREMGEKREN